MTIMPYDEASFLAGVAAGRNMRSWPRMLDEAETEIFMFDVDCTISTRLNIEVCYFTGLILWGDGTTTEYNHSAGVVHTYASTGIYRVQMIGALTLIRFGNASSSRAEQIRAAFMPLPRIPDGASLTVTSNFENCDRLIYITGDYYRNYAKQGVQLNTLMRAFYGCSSLTSVPSGLYDGIEVLPFNGEYSLESMFQSCTSLIAVRGPIFSAPAAQTFTSANLMFNNCQSLVSFPQNFFDRMTGIENFVGCFGGCRNLESPVPELWISHPDADGRYCFDGCTKAANYADIPPEWR